MLSLHTLKTSSRARTSGVTLIEAAIVMMIVALLLIAVLGYKEVIRLTMLRKIATEVQSFGTAARAFEDKYDSLPGDFANADQMLPNCQVIDNTQPYGGNNGNAAWSNPNFCQNGDGDGQIGRYCFFTWNECIQTGGAIPGADPNGEPIPRGQPLETSMFWKHLYLSNFIGGIVVPTGDPRNPVWGISHPKSAREGAGYVISGNGNFLGGYVVVNFLPLPTTNPNQGILVGEPGADKALSVQDAFYMDRKYDDEQPGDGKLWWNPISNGGPNGCRRNDNNAQNAWEMDNLEGRNCIFNWTVY